MLTDDKPGSSHNNLPGPSDASGQAALLLVESLIHGLCEASTLTARQAVEIAERARDVQLEAADEGEESDLPKRQAHDLLSSIAASLRVDEIGGQPPLTTWIQERLR